MSLRPEPGGRRGGLLDGRGMVARNAPFALAAVLALLGATGYAQKVPFSPEAADEDPNAVAWLVAGPFAEERRRPFADPLDIDFLPGGEAGARPAPVQSVEAQAWMPVDSAAGIVDFSAEFGTSPLSAAYAFREFRSATSRKAILSVEFRGQAKVWLNGEPVLARRSALAGTQAERVIELEEGLNSLLVKSLGGGSSWAFALSIRDAVEEPRGSAREAELQLLERVAPRGGFLRGLVIPGRRSGEGEVHEIVARDSSGGILASVSAFAGEGFELGLPESFSGPCFVGIEGGPFAARSTSAGGVAALAGDFASLAAARAAEARALALSLDPSLDETAARTEGWMDAGASMPRPPAPGDRARAARLLYLASRIAGGGTREPAGFEADARALAELGILLEEPVRNSGAVSAPGRLETRAFRLARGGLGSYLLRLPEDWDGQSPCGLVLCVPGEEEGREAAGRLSGSSLPGMVLAAPGRVAGPAEAAETTETTAPTRTEAAALELAELLDVIAGFHRIDLDRIYLVGWASGGAAALNAAAYLSDRLTGVVSFSGLPEDRLVSGLAGLEVLIVRGTEDERITRAVAQAAAARIEDAGGRPRLVAVPGPYPWRAAPAGDPAAPASSSSAAAEGWGSAELLVALAKMRRAPWPLRVSRRTSDPSLGRAAWLRLIAAIDGSQPMEAAASVLDARHLEVSTANVAAFELVLGHPSLAALGRVVVTVDGRALAADAMTVPRFVKSGPAFEAP